MSIKKSKKGKSSPGPKGLNLTGYPDTSARGVHGGKGAGYEDGGESAQEEEGFGLDGGGFTGNLNAIGVDKKDDKK